MLKRISVFLKKETESTLIFPVKGPFSPSSIYFYHLKAKKRENY